MKTLTNTTIAMVMALSLSSAVIAENSKEEQLDMCKTLSSLAGSVMTARQKGMAKSTLTSIIVKAGGNSIEADVTKGMVDVAYETPQHSSTEDQLIAVSTMKSTMYENCFEKVL